jgi:hypothetical protein
MGQEAFNDDVDSRSVLESRTLYVALVQISFVVGPALTFFRTFLEVKCIFSMIPYRFSKIGSQITFDKDALYAMSICTHVMNAITNHGIFCTYPNQTLGHHITLNSGSCPTNGTFPLAVQKLLVKQAKRLFCIDINSIIAVERPHECHLSTVCPHTSQHLFGDCALVICYNNT